MPFLQFTPTASHYSPCDKPSERERAVRKNTGSKKRCPRETQSSTNAPGLSTPHLSGIVPEPPPPSLCSRPSSHHPSNLTSVYLVHALLVHTRYSSIIFTCPNHLNTLLSALLADSLSIPAVLRTTSFLTLSIPFLTLSNVLNSRTFTQGHSLNSLSTSHTPCLCSVQRRWYSYF